MDVQKLKFINEYKPSVGGSYITEELNELYDNKEGLTVDDFKDPKNSHFDKKTGEEYICGFPVVYQITAHGNIPSIFKNGFDRAFTGSRAGNMYGPGTYSTYRLSSSEQNVKHGIYGDTFVKMLVLSKFSDFLIYDKAIAQRVYGQKWTVKDQLHKYFSPEECKEFMYKGIWGRMTNMEPENGKTSVSVLQVWSNLGDTVLVEHGIAGFIFHGGHDGYVCVIRDFKNILPIAYSTNGGHNWKNDVFTQDTVNTIFYDVDAHTFLGNDVRKYQDTKKTNSGLNKRINDLIMVKEGGKYNFLDIEKNKLSPLVSFDTASPVRENGLAFVTINDPKYVDAVGEPFEGYVSLKGVHNEEDPDEFIPWEKFNRYLKNIGF
jgi:hypothetical protein